jgi:hypothetical protein
VFDVLWAILYPPASAPKYKSIVTNGEKARLSQNYIDSIAMKMQSSLNSWSLRDLRFPNTH